MVQQWKRNHGRSHLGCKWAIGKNTLKGSVIVSVIVAIKENDTV